MGNAAHQLKKGLLHGNIGFTGLMQKCDEAPWLFTEMLHTGNSDPWVSPHHRTLIQTEAKIAWVENEKKQTLLLFFTIVKRQEQQGEGLVENKSK